ncbi:MAG: signal peptidase II [Sulfurovaceae bacterium]|nr:signal peptidase II [Sulfurovaceae bacterium]MDD5549507.1 signal peptidase II [Sulfurovaceae bacterium]
MKNNYVFFTIAVFSIFIADQIIKSIFVSGFELQSSCISLELHYNNGVAFSMLAFLGENLKWLQLALVGVLAFFMIKDGYLEKYSIPAGVLVGAALGNLSDRFVYGGVVDYVAWHCGFDFAVFNFADVMIDFAIGWFLIYEFWLKNREKQK